LLEEISMDELIASVTKSLGLEPDVAQQAIGTVLRFLKENAPAEAGALLEKLTGSQEAIDAAPEAGGGGGLMGALGGLMGGGGAGGLMGLAGQLQGLGLGMGDIQGLAQDIFAKGNEVIGKEQMKKIASAIPGLDQYV
jgi:hypothetical protein